MPNPFSIYHFPQINDYDENIPDIKKGSECILLEYREITPTHTGHCSDSEWTEKISINTVYIPIPKYMYNDNNKIKEEFKFIMDNDISEDNLPDWFEEWDEKIRNCNGSGYCGYYSKKIVYIPLSYTYILSFEGY